MYAPQFGLKKKPFPLLPAGPEVFVSPHAATLITQIRAACADNDAIVTVSGPSGVGKTTLVKRALGATGLRRQTVTIDGEPLQADQVLESLLTLFGFTDLPGSKDERLVAWQQKLNELKAADTHVFIVIESAQATGPEVIEELAALSAAEGDKVVGARMVIMGDDNLGDLIDNAKLAEVQRRTSLAHTVSPFCEAEIRGYLKHSLRVAGGNFDTIFADDCVPLLLKLSEGIPRTVNAIVETILAAAAAQNVHPITAKLAADVAARFYDPVTDRFHFKPRASDNNGRKPTGETRDSTQVPDLEALARAIAVAQGDSPTTSARANGNSDSASWAERSLTLSDTARERTITCGMDSAGEFGMAADIVTAKIKVAGEQLEDIAQRLSEARSLDDVDDEMAETLFGEELNDIASMVTGKKNAKPAANDQASRPGGRKEQVG